jgi:dolichol kinase
MGGGVVILSVFMLSNLDGRDTGIILISYSLLNFMFEFFRLGSERFNKMVLSVLGSFMREEERKKVSGMPFYALGCGLSFYLFPEKISILSILFLTFSDPISSTIGVLYGKHQFLPNKSIQGSIAGFFVCFFITYVGLISWGAGQTNLVAFCFIAGIIGSFSELLSVLNLDDNLTIPLFSGLGLFALNNLLHIL